MLVKNINGGKMKLFLEKVKYDYKDLSPSMSSETLEYHRDNLAAGYVKNFNNNTTRKNRL